MKATTKNIPGKRVVVDGKTILIVEKGVSGEKYNRRAMYNPRKK